MAAIGGSVSIEGEAQKNCQSPLNSLRPCSISFASVSAVMRRLPVAVAHGEEALLDAVSNHEARDSSCETRPKAAPRDKGSRRSEWFYVTFLDANVALRLSNNSTFTPLRRMIKLCCSTDSVLFQAQ